MTSVAIAQHPFQQSTEIIETTPYYQDMLNPETLDQEMEDDITHNLLENGDDDQDMYNADNQSTVVEPPQSDAVMTHAPSTILDEMEYLDDIDYEEDQITKPVDPFHLTEEPQVSSHTPPAESSIPLHPQIFSPASRVVPRPTTPLVTNLPSNIVDTDPTDDEWPVCLETPTGQEYILFRSDGDTEALFEDSWLKSQSLETFFSSLRQTLEDELSSLTSSFSMEEIVLAIPDLQVSIAEDNCYTREISLQDLVNLMNSLHVKNGTERPEVCKILLSLQPRFIARFNQLVSLSAQTWDSTIHKTKFDVQEQGDVEEDDVDEQEDVEEQNAVEPDVANEEDVQDIVEYEEYEDDENEEQVQEYEEDDSTGVNGPADEPAESVLEADAVGVEADVNDGESDDGEAGVQDDQDEETEDAEDEQNEDVIEEDGLYEENEESYDPNPQSAEQISENEDDQGEEDQQQVNVADIPEEHVASRQDTDDGDENDDLISYEEAVDQTEDGQDYRQQYIDDTVSQNYEQNGETNGDYMAYNQVPALVDIAPQITQTDDTQPADEIEDVGSPQSKRPLDQIVDPSVDDARPLKRAKS